MCVWVRSAIWCWCLGLSSTHHVAAPAAMPGVALYNWATHLDTLGARCYSCFEACCSACPDQLNRSCSMGEQTHTHLWVYAVGGSNSGDAALAAVLSQQYGALLYLRLESRATSSYRSPCTNLVVWFDGLQLEVPDTHRLLGLQHC
jgi:hypothetical protein